MTRGDYLLLAQAMRENKTCHKVHISETAKRAMRMQWELDCRQLAFALLQGNKVFDVKLFLKNCGVDL